MLYIGDFDPSGINMIEEAENWIRDAAGLGSDLLVHRVAVTEADHADHGLPHLPVNHRDVRAADFVRRYGTEVVEVEALPPQVLQSRLRDAIERHRDGNAWARALGQEIEDRAELVRRIDGI